MDKKQFRFWTLICLGVLLGVPVSGWLLFFTLDTVAPSCNVAGSACGTVVEALGKGVFFFGLAAMVIAWSGLIWIVRLRERQLGFSYGWTVAFALWLCVSTMFLLGRAYTGEDPFRADALFDAIGIPTSLLFIVVLLGFLSLYSSPKPFHQGVGTLIAWGSAAISAGLSTQQQPASTLWVEFGVFAFALIYILLEQRSAGNDGSAGKLLLDEPDARRTPGDAVFGRRER